MSESTYLPITLKVNKFNSKAVIREVHRNKWLPQDIRKILD